jgi:hypothetical protein
MRAYQWLGAVAVLAAFVAPARAQSYNPFFGGVNTSNITYNVINPTANGTIASPQTVTTNSSIINFFHAFGRSSAAPVIGTSTFPTLSQQPGPSYLSGFGFYSPGH